MWVAKSSGSWNSLGDVVGGGVNPWDPWTCCLGPNKKFRKFGLNLDCCGINKVTFYWWVLRVSSVLSLL